MPQPLWQQTLETTGNAHCSALPAHSKNALCTSDGEEAPKEKRPPWDLRGSMQANCHRWERWSPSGGDETRAGRNMEATIQVSSWDAMAGAGGPLKSPRARAPVMECLSPGRIAKCASRAVARAPRPDSHWRRCCLMPIPGSPSAPPNKHDWEDERSPN